MPRTTFRLPDLGEGVVEGEIVAWHVQPGDIIEEDQPLLDIMTDKATVTIPSPLGGQIVNIHGEVGEMASVGSELIVFEETPTLAAIKSEPVTVGSMAGTSEPSGPRPVNVGRSRPEPSDRPLASPAVRRRAREKGVDLDQVHGTGRGGRITDADIDQFINRPTSSGATSAAKRTGTSEIHISGVRRKIAEKMSVSSSHIPHFSYFEQVDITELAALRKFLNERRGTDEPKLTYLPFVMLALAKAFLKHPEANAHYDDKREVVTRFEAAHLGIATQTERGLFVPVVRHVEAMDLFEAARELRRVTQAVRHNTIERDELIGSTFTITSLGALGGLGATPIINHPEVGILGIHKAYDRPVVQNSQVVVRHMVNLSSSFDHRVVDGADGAALIQTVKEMLEHPALVFL